jgi:hypothetical protein
MVFPWSVVFYLGKPYHMLMTEHPSKSENNGLAIASLVLGILSVTGFSILTGIPAIITGAIGLKNPNGKGMSIAGIIMGGVSVVFAILIAIFIVFLILIGLAADSSSSSSQGSDTYDRPPTSSIQRT